MALIDRLLDNLGLTTKARASTRTASILRYLPGMEGDEGPDYAKVENQQRAYGSSATVFWCVRQKANTASAYDFQVAKRVQGEESVEQIPNHPFEMLLQRPHPHITRQDLFRATFSFLSINGNAYWYLAFDGSGEPVEITEVGAIIWRGTEPLAKVSNIIKTDALIPPHVARLTGITNDMVDEQGIGMDEFIHKLEDIMSTNGVQAIVAHNAFVFDRQILDRAGLARSWVWHDTKLIWKAAILGLEIGAFESLDHFYGRVQAERSHAKTNLAWLSKALGLTDTKQEHRAMADCIMLSDLWFHTVMTGIFDNVMGQHVGDVA